ncbi:MAG: thioesterase [Lachnospiraceae bacterium]|nr:thioesterase [Lachnospiraceae bacterium]MDY6221779.1 thioesterase [Candidatus Alectryocaccobium sp.]
MIYSFKGRVRYSETDKDGYLAFPSLLDYFQDTSTFHGEDNGLTIDLLYKENIAWVLGAWQVRLFKKARIGDHITSSTWAYKFNHSLGFRDYSLSDENGELIAAAETQYVLLDFKSQTPVTIPEYFAEKYTIETEAHRDLKLRRKILSAKTGAEFPQIPVSEYMLDTNHHVNNTQYIKTAMSFLSGKQEEFNCFRAEYKKQAHLGDVFYPVLSELENGTQIRLCDKDGSLFFIGEWTTEENKCFK